MHDATTYLCEDCGVEGYRTKTGRILTNEDIEVLAEAAYGDMAERYGPDEG